MDYQHITNLWINSLLQAFAQLGLNPEALIDGLSGFEDCQLQEGQQLELAAARTLWHRAEQLSDDPLLGFRIGRMISPRAVGVLLPVCWHSPDALTALQHIANYQKLISENGLFRITEYVEGQQISCEYVPSADRVAVSQHQVLSVVTSTIKMLQQVSIQPLGLNPLKVPAELDATRLAAALRYPVENHAGHFTLIMDKASLTQPIIGRDKHLYEISLAYAEAMQRNNRAQKTLVDQIKKYIDISQPALVNIEQVANEIGLQPRVIQRHLLDQGTSFRALKESVLKARALDFLITRNLSVKVTAQRLGYSEPSAFHRAFKSWFQVSPRQYLQKKI